MSPGDERRTFAVVALFEPIAARTTIDRSRWPAHVTLAPNFHAVAPLGEIETASFPEVLVNYPLVLRVGASAAFGDDGDVPVRRIDHIPATSAHRRLAARLARLEGFEAERPDFWLDGYRPHLTLGNGIGATSGELRRVHSIALVELLQTTATVRASRAVDDLAPLDRVDLQVALPASATPATVQVVRFGADLEFPGTVTILTSDGTRVSTAARDGIRWRYPGRVDPIQTIADVALAAVYRLLTDEIPLTASAGEEQQQRAAAEREAERLSALLRDTGVWSVGPVLVDGVRFALFQVPAGRGVAGVVDLGFSTVGITAPRIPDDFALQLVPASRLQLFSDAPTEE